jgi:fructokinase
LGKYYLLWAIMTVEHKIRIGVDVGGTKIEALALDADGKELGRHRVPTPVGDYRGTAEAIAGLVHRLESETGRSALVGMGIPGTVTAKGLVKNANSICLNGNPFQKDVSALLNREVRCANDANCLAVSEATDGAGAGFGVVFAVILGTGCGGGIAINGRASAGQVHAGPNGVAGEWGHIPLPWQSPEEFPGPPCYCGKQGCIETWISGTGFSADYERISSLKRTGAEITAAANAGDEIAALAVSNLYNRIARSLAMAVNLLDPDVIVIGGGLSLFSGIYEAVPPLMRQHVFGHECDTPVRQALHGDSSGVRGAAWLWPLEK